MPQKYLLVYQMKTGGWNVSNHAYNAPRGIPHGVQRLRKTFNYVGAANPVVRCRAIAITVDPDKGVETSGIYKEYEI